MECGAMVGRHLWRQAGVGPEDVSIANLYDGFSMLTPMWAEALGFCGEGEGFSWMNETSLPLNTSSGNLGSGRTHGISQMLDSVLQLMGRARPTRRSKARSSPSPPATCWTQAGASCSGRTRARARFKLWD